MDRGVIPGLPLQLQVVGRIARKHGFNGLLKALPTDANSVLPIHEKEFLFLLNHAMKTAVSSNSKK